MKKKNITKSITYYQLKKYIWMLLIHPLWIKPTFLMSYELLGGRADLRDLPLIILFSFIGVGIVHPLLMKAVGTTRYNLMVDNHKKSVEFANTSVGESGDIENWNEHYEAEFEVLSEVTYIPDAYESLTNRKYSKAPRKR